VDTGGVIHGSEERKQHHQPAASPLLPPSTTASSSSSSSRPQSAAKRLSSGNNTQLVINSISSDDRKSTSPSAMNSGRKFAFGDEKPSGNGIAMNAGNGLQQQQQYTSPYATGVGNKPAKAVDAAMRASYDGSSRQGKLQLSFVLLDQTI
jgi:hypothetical protein